MTVQPCMEWIPIKKIFFEGFILKQMKHPKTENAHTMCWTNYCQNGVYNFAYQCFWIKSTLLLIEYLASVASDIHIDELKPSSD